MAYDECKKISEIIRNLPPEEAVSSIRSMLRGSFAPQFIIVSSGSPTLSEQKTVRCVLPSLDSEEQETIRSASPALIAEWPFCLLPYSKYFSDYYELLVNVSGRKYFSGILGVTVVR
ncbi:3519_t:CDS:2 [Dentiscutata erythropus]|uniref:3519_t:CDS:1 n=1 Tax=Dentiscutata erythropus TaxID=1348616 RepID=A0A9N8ZTM8_9GLOM|nr:3519_t:CDS:2 [Dentiscutata erythropus]